MLYTLLKEGRDLTACVTVQSSQGGRGTHKIESSPNLHIVLPQEAIISSVPLCVLLWALIDSKRNGHVISPASTVI